LLTKLLTIMKQLYTILFCLVFITFSFAQDDKIVEEEEQEKGGFADVIREHLKKHNINSDIAYEKSDFGQGQMLYDSLVYKHLSGTTFEDYNLKSLNRKDKWLSLSSFNKPVFILTYASWCVPSAGEIPALNKLAQKYAKDVQFVILFWDRKHDLKKISKKFNHNIAVCYAHETYRYDEVVVSHLKHTLGFPTSYFLDKDLKVVNIKRGVAQPDKKSSYVQAYTMNYNAFRKGLSSLLIDKNITEEKLTTN
jgi:thiol-disulfide isomerase/thioredoxin